MANREYETLNHFLVNVFYEILKAEEQSISSTEFPNLSLREIHLLEKIYLAEKNGSDNSSAAIAAALRITPGTLTTAASLLEKKGYLSRQKDENDKRIVRLTVTKKGTAAQKQHEEFHHEMVEGILSALNPDEAEAFASALLSLETFFNEKYHNSSPTTRKGIEK